MCKLAAMIAYLICSDPSQFHSSAVKDRNKPFSENSIQTAFYYEARRLWELEEGRDSLTKVQAGLVFCKYRV